MTKRLVSIQPQATPFYASVQLMAEEVRPQLDALWSDIKSAFAGQTIKEDGFRPRQVTQADVEASDLTRAYYQYWFTNLVEALTEKTDKRVAYVTDLNTTKQGNSFIVSAIVFPQPEVSYSPSKEEFMRGLAEIFLKDRAVEDLHVEEEIINRKMKVRFDKNRMQLDREYSELLKDEDVVYVELTNEFSRSQNRPPEQHIIRISPECPPVYRDALTGARVGDDVISSKELDPQGKQRVTIMMKIVAKVDAPEVTDEEMCQVGGYANPEAMRLNVKREMERNISTNFDELFATYIRTRTSLSPIPGPMVFDRAEGYVNHLLQSKSQAELRRAGITDPQATIQGLLPRFNDEIYRETVCSEIAKELGLAATTEDLADWFQRNSVTEMPEARYVAEMDILIHRVTTYYRTKGEDRGDVKRVVGATSLDDLSNQVPAKRNNLIHLT